MIEAAKLHDACEPLAFLLGMWRGEGHGEYPGIEGFDYGEETRFSHVGKPFLSYAQRSWSLVNESPLHSEVGFWRPQPDGSLEVVLAHPFGVVEIQHGRVDGERIELAKGELYPTDSADPIEGLTRRLTVEGEELSYTVEMASSGHPLQRHLSARLKRLT